MSRMNGFELLEQFRRDKELRAIPVIVISAKVDRHVDCFYATCARESSCHQQSIRGRHQRSQSGFEYAASMVDQLDPSQAAIRLAMKG